MGGACGRGVRDLLVAPPDEERPQAAFKSFPSCAVNLAGGTGGITLQLAEQILKGDRAFSDWLLDSNVKARAKKWFPNDLTFSKAYARFVDPLGRGGRETIR